MNDQNDSGAYTRGFIIGALVGGAAGAITALLLAPKSGAELRKDIATKSSDIYEKAQDYFDVVGDNVGVAITNTVNDGRLRAESIIEKAKTQAGEILSSAENILKDAKSKASQTKDSIQEKVDNIREATKAGKDAFRAELDSRS